MRAPRFVVVGHVNRGKSSLVSTLAADDSVRIDDAPGTTQSCREYPMREKGETLYTLIDTPGFERARRALHWLRAHETTTAERRKTVERFVAKHQGSGEFPQECELLRPILAGAAILYVVDGSVPFSPIAEAEAEILRWTGQPRLALINSIGDRDYSGEWRPVLDQYFSLVRTFDAHQADFAGRIELLRALRELDESWRDALDRAIALLVEARNHAARECAGLIADTLVNMLTLVEEKRLPPHTDPETYKPDLSERFYDRLRESELSLREGLRRVYQHHDLRVEQAMTGPESEDLFDLSSWSRLGLSRMQLAAGGAATGALVGAGIDASVGGASMLLGTALGGVTGLASSWWAWGQLAEVKVLGANLGGTALRIGPLKSPAFPWVVLERALHLHRIVSNRAHARRGEVHLEHDAGIVSALGREQRKPLSDCFDRLRQNATSSRAEVEAEHARRLLPGLIAPLLQESE
jgi:hypothetical protein